MSIDECKTCTCWKIEIGGNDKEDLKKIKELVNCKSNMNEIKTYKIKNLVKESPVEIIWRDSNIYTGQTNDLEDKYDIAVIRTCGFFIEARDGYIIIARDIIENAHRGVIVIPEENIITVV